MGKYDILFSLDIKILNLASKLLTVTRLPMMLKNRKCIEKNINLKRYKKSDRCYVIGLGPSLKSVDLTKLEGDTIVTNRYVYYTEAQKIEPTFYCLPDSAFYNKDDSKDVLVKALEMFPDSVFLLNGKDKAATESCVPANTKAFYTYTWGGYLNPEKDLDFCKVLPLIGNVACYGIMLALYLNYKEIVLIGCDFSSFASRKAIHCYDESDDSRKITMSFDLFCYSFVAYTHICLEQYAKRKATQIINATRGSLIDAYKYDEDMIEALQKRDI